jgi:hypothetical protein
MIDWLSNLLISLAQLIKENYRNTNYMAEVQRLNIHIGDFFNDLLCIMDRGCVFEMVRPFRAQSAFLFVELTIVRHAFTDIQLFARAGQSHAHSPGVVRHEMRPPENVGAAPALRRPQFAGTRPQVCERARNYQAVLAATLPSRVDIVAC